MQSARWMRCCRRRWLPPDRPRHGRTCAERPFCGWRSWHGSSGPGTCGPAAAPQPGFLRVRDRMWPVPVLRHRSIWPPSYQIAPCILALKGEDTRRVHRIARLYRSTYVPLMQVHKAYRFRIYPTDEQRVLLAKVVGLCRLVYNLALEQRCLDARPPWHER
ncbi:hypothetical protein FS320_43995 [Microvirga tunisiensis]|uniref:Transposase putative helix-turn-helix domain-containing protein n=1 Tax=Microvirga tunisiensis TaxID=2108360 RepID=A0A5N7MXC7_9HYPH|nr:hypothetical protein [Microvirga tunisiensis]MPR31612.1 hypothetical protein [Microvirga tunisiensis]